MKIYATCSHTGSKFVVIAAALLLATVGSALAQTDFQLPRECLERQVVSPERCVIQDGPPRLPLVPLARRPDGTTGTPTTTPPPVIVTPVPRIPPASLAPAAARR
jgi:hypothetical protein